MSSDKQGITLIDSSIDSLTVSWPSSSNDTDGSIRYVLQYRKASDNTPFETLSDKLSSTVARKRNLSDSDGVGYIFRVTTKQEYQLDADSPSWTTHSEPFFLLSQDQERHRMAAPTVTLAGAHLAGLIRWNAAANATAGYELQMRANEGGAAWQTIASSLNGTEVRKKNLPSNNGYQFRVRPNHPEAPFSPPSEIFVALGLSEGMKHLFYPLENQVLLQKQNQPPVPLEDTIGGKEFVLFYASAKWCPPCRQFTPQLANWYNSLGPNKSIEIVFLSCDHDANGFNEYYSTMPWAAVPFDDDGREALMAHIRVQGIPRLAVLDGRTGRIIEDNAVGKPFDIGRWKKLAGS